MAKICIDAGHGGVDSGAVGVNGRLEKTDNLNAALALQKVMTSRGHSVIMTRTKDTYPSLNDRVKLANNSGVDVFISLHRNSYSDPNSNGFEVLYGTNASQRSIKLAETMVDKVVKVTGFRNRGAKRQSATVLNGTNMPAVTVESGFITNSSDNNIYDAKNSVLLTALADSIESVIGKGSNPAPDPKPSDPYSYELVKPTTLWKDEGIFTTGTDVTLEAAPVTIDGQIIDGMARVKLNGSLYLVPQGVLKKK